MPRPVRSRKPATATATTTATIAVDTAPKPAPVKKTAAAPAAATKARSTRSTAAITTTTEAETPVSSRPIRRSVVAASKEPEEVITATKAAIVKKKTTRSKIAVSPISPNKRPSTRHRAAESTPVATDSPKKTPTARRKPAAAVSVTKKKATPRAKRLSTPPPQLPEIQVVRTPSPEEESPIPSSNAENHAPSSQDRILASSALIPSSPPIAQSTPYGRQKITLQFSPGAGYTPPPPNLSRGAPDSSERPRLQELETETLEPLLNFEDDNGNYGEDFETPGSPTPKRGRVGRFLELPGEGSVTPQPTRSGSPIRGAGAATTGKGFFINGDDEEFIIYSDPKSPSLPIASQQSSQDLTSTMRPPESSSASSTPQGKKRRSSGAIINLESDLHEEDDEEEEAPGKGKRRKQTQPKPQNKKKKEPQPLKTDDLREFLPRRRRSIIRDRDELDFPSTSTIDENLSGSTAAADDDSEDELSTVRPSRRSAATKQGAATKVTKPPAKKSKATTTAAAPRKTRSSSKPPAAAATAIKKTTSSSSPTKKTPQPKTYTRKDKENTTPKHKISVNSKTPLSNHQEEEESTETSSIELADGKVDKSGRRKLKAMAEKFREVDRWEMEFEDVSPASLDSGSQRGVAR